MPADERLSEVVNVRMTAPEADRVYRAAARARVSVSKLLRSRLSDLLSAAIS